MFEFLSQFDQLLCGAGGIVVGALGCWFVQKIVCRQSDPSARSRQTAIQNLQSTALQWGPAKQDDAAAALKQRAAEDELVLQWLAEKPAGTLTQCREACQTGEANPKPAAHPELALSQIASELLPFNPLVARLSGKTADSEMKAANLTETVERIEKLLASVDPPETLGRLASLESATSIRDPQGRMNSQPEFPQRRRSDQAINYDTLLRRCLGDDDFAWRMLHKFPSRCRVELDSLATELRRRAWTAATRRINQLRGIAANMAADNLRDALGNLETVCRQQSATRAKLLLESVQVEFQQVLEFMARAEGICRLEHHACNDSQPISRWPAGSLMFDEQRGTPFSSVPAETDPETVCALAEPVAPEQQSLTMRSN